MPKTRPFILRLFLRWLKSSRSRFLVPSPQVVSGNDKSINFTFPGLAGNIGGYFNRRSGITIYVNHNKETWDLLGDFDAIEEKSDRGYFCSLCLPEYREHYPTREAFWTEHCFENFLQWCNETLKPANWLGLYDYDGVTEARLLRDKCEDRWNESVIKLKRDMRHIDGLPPKDDSEKYMRILIPLRKSIKSLQEVPK